MTNDDNISHAATSDAGIAFDLKISPKGRRKTVPVEPAQELTPLTPASIPSCTGRSSSNQSSIRWLNAR